MNLNKMAQADFGKDFTSIRRIYNVLAPYKEKGIFEGGQKHNLEAAESAAIVKALQFPQEFAELISATDIGATADVLDRAIIAAYRDYFNDPSRDLTQITVKRPVRDTLFSTITYSDIENFSKKKDHEGYDAAYIDVAKQLDELEMWGKLIHVDYKAWRSNRGEILRTLPTRLGVAGKRTTMRILAQAMYEGWNKGAGTFYTVANGNYFNLALTPTNLETVLNNMALMVDPMNNEPRGTVMVNLVVPLSMENTAKRIVNPILGTLAISTISGNVINYQLKVIANPMLDRYTTTGWWLFAQNIGDQGPLVEAYLEGNEVPEIFVKTSDAQRIAGGGPEEMGDFRTDNISWKGRITRKAYFIPDLYWMSSFV
jgi:hypothetical protein